VDKKLFGKEADSCIVTSTGRLVNPLELKEEDVEPEDIAHALSNQCRFSGHTTQFYSVAEHSVRVAKWVKDRGGSVEDERCALLHDASEAYLVDIPRPLKMDAYFGRTYRGAEERAMKVICRRFGVAPGAPPIVNDGDIAVFTAERRDIMPWHEIWRLWSPPAELDVPSAEIKPWTPAKAKKEWLRRFHLLFGERAPNP
jgi:hypothetical protein